MNTATSIEGHGILGLVSPWARAKVPEPLRSELAALIPQGFTVGVSVAPNNGRVKVWVNTPDQVAAKTFLGYDAPTHIRAAIDWIEQQDDEPDLNIEGQPEFNGAFR